ncbi:MAG: killer suppression protein [Deltaproteobacteria bacterium]|nr:killer suppression protein [Deltaproteobacteria bacterium]
MYITFINRKLEKLFLDEKALKRKWGPEQAEKIKLRVTQLLAAERLEIMHTLPQVRAHELSGNRAGQISLDLKHPYRLLIKPDYENPPHKDDGGLDWKKITKIKVLGVEDTHG